MPNDRIALVLFAGKAYLQMPLTTDHGAARMFVTSASPDAIPQQGTVVSDALNMSVNAFSENDKKFKAVVLVTDGEDHDNSAASSARGLSEQGVMINTVGIGSSEGSTIPDVVPGENKKDNVGNVIVSKLNEAMLQELATVTNGAYVRLQSSDDAVKKIEQQLSQIDKKAFEDESQMNFKTFYMWPAGLMLLLLIGEIFVSEKRRLTV
jgi:Ca-activated chloride channel family protein